MSISLQTPPSELEQYAEGLIKEISNIAENVGMIATKSKKMCHSKPWFDEDCVNCKRSLEVLLKNCKQNMFELESLTLYINKKKGI